LINIADVRVTLSTGETVIVPGGSTFSAKNLSAAARTIAQERLYSTPITSGGTSPIPSTLGTVPVVETAVDKLISDPKVNSLPVDEAVRQLRVVPGPDTYQNVFIPALRSSVPGTYVTSVGTFQVSQGRFGMEVVRVGSTGTVANSPTVFVPASMGDASVVGDSSVSRRLRADASVVTGESFDSKPKSASLMGIGDSGNLIFESGLPGRFLSDSSTRTLSTSDQKNRTSISFNKVTVGTGSYDKNYADAYRGLVDQVREGYKFSNLYTYVNDKGETVMSGDLVPINPLELSDNPAVAVRIVQDLGISENDFKSGKFDFHNVGEKIYLIDNTNKVKQSTIDSVKKDYTIVPLGNINTLPEIGPAVTKYLYDKGYLEKTGEKYDLEVGAVVPQFGLTDKAKNNISQITMEDTGFTTLIIKDSRSSAGAISEQIDRNIGKSIGDANIARTVENKMSVEDAILRKGSPFFDVNTAGIPKVESLLKDIASTPSFESGKFNIPVLKLGGPLIEDIKGEAVYRGTQFGSFILPNVAADRSKYGLVGLAQLESDSTARTRDWILTKSVPGKLLDFKASAGDKSLREAGSEISTSIASAIDKAPDRFVLGQVREDIPIYGGKEIGIDIREPLVTQYENLSRPAPTVEESAKTFMKIQDASRREAYTKAELLKRREGESQLYGIVPASIADSDIYKKLQYGYGTPTGKLAGSIGLGLGISAAASVVGTGIERVSGFILKYADDVPTIIDYNAGNRFALQNIVASGAGGLLSLGQKASGVLSNPKVATGLLGGGIVLKEAPAIGQVISGKLPGYELVGSVGSDVGLVAGGVLGAQAGAEIIRSWSISNAPFERGITKGSSQDPLVMNRRISTFRVNEPVGRFDTNLGGDDVLRGDAIFDFDTEFKIDPTGKILGSKSGLQVGPGIGTRADIFEGLITGKTSPDYYTKWWESSLPGPADTTIAGTSKPVDRAYSIVDGKRVLVPKGAKYQPGTSYYKPFVNTDVNVQPLTEYGLPRGVSTRDINYLLELGNSFEKRNIREAFETRAVDKPSEFKNLKAVEMGRSQESYATKEFAESQSDFLKTFQEGGDLPEYLGDGRYKRYLVEFRPSTGLETAQYIDIKTGTSAARVTRTISGDIPTGMKDVIITSKPTADELARSIEASTNIRLETYKLPGEQIRDGVGNTFTKTIVNDPGFQSFISRNPDVLVPTNEKTLKLWDTLGSTFPGGELKKAYAAELGNREFTSKTTSTIRYIDSPIDDSSIDEFATVIDMRGAPLKDIDYDNFYSKVLPKSTVQKNLDPIKSSTVKGTSSLYSDVPQSSISNIDKQFVSSIGIQKPYFVSLSPTIPSNTIAGIAGLVDNTKVGYNVNAISSTVNSLDNKSRNRFLPDSDSQSNMRSNFKSIVDTRSGTSVDTNTFTGTKPDVVLNTVPSYDTGLNIVPVYNVNTNVNTEPILEPKIEIKTETVLEPMFKLETLPQVIPQFKPTYKYEYGSSRNYNPFVTRDRSRLLRRQPSRIKSSRLSGSRITPDLFSSSVSQAVYGKSTNPRFTKAESRDLRSRGLIRVPTVEYGSNRQDSRTVLKRLFG